MNYVIAQLLLGMTRGYTIVGYMNGRPEGWRYLANPAQPFHALPRRTAQQNADDLATLVQRLIDLHVARRSILGAGHPCPHPHPIKV